MYPSNNEKANEVVRSLYPPHFAFEYPIPYDLCGRVANLDDLNQMIENEFYL